MGRTTPEGGSASALVSPAGATVTLLSSISTLLALFAKRANRASKKLESKLKSARLERICPNRLLKSASNKAIAVMRKNKYGEKASRRDADEWGDGGIWQKAILMGDKCQPLDFSGVIYYDSNGKQLNEVPLRSPRASPLPGFVSTNSSHQVC